MGVQLPRSFLTLQPKSLWRLRAPISSGEVRRIERWLATARVFLAISALVTIWMDPGEVHYSIWAYGLLGFYIIHGVTIMLLLRFRQQSTLAFRLLVHGADVVWPALISVFATGQHNPFFLFFVFVMAAAAYRWGVWETVGTAAAALILLWAESLAFHLGFIQWVDGMLLRHGLPLLRVDLVEFEPKHLFMRSIYLMVLGLLLGYLAEQQKQLRAEKAVIARVLGRARVEAGLTGTLQDILSDLVTMYGAKQALVASQEANSRHVFVGEVRALNGTPTAFHWLEPTPEDRDTYLYLTAADACCVTRNSRGFAYVGLSADGTRIRELPLDFLQPLGQQLEFRRLTTISFLFGREWGGRIFLLDPELTTDPEEELHFCRSWCARSGPRFITCTCCAACGCAPARSNAPVLPANCTTAPCSR